MGRLPILAGIAAALVVTAVAAGAAGDVRVHRLHLPPPARDGAPPPAAGGADASNPAAPGTTVPSPPALPGTPPPAPPPAAAVGCSAGGSGADVTGTLSDYAIALSAPSVAAAPSLSFRGTYPAGGDAHNLTLRDSTGEDLCGTANLGVGASGAFTVANLPAGSYQLVCTLHAAFGMKVPFTVG
jgi:hypothetical protein